MTAANTGVVPFPHHDPHASVELIDPSTGTFHSMSSVGIRKTFTANTGRVSNIAAGNLAYTSPVELSGSQNATVSIVEINGQGRLGITFTGGSGKTAQFVSDDPYQVAGQSVLVGFWSNT